MDVLADLLTPQERETQEDFKRRDQGPPWEGFDDNEAYQEYNMVAPRLSEEQYRASARAAFERLTPEQRLEFGRWLREQSRQQHVRVPDLDQDGIDDRLQDADYLAGATTRLRQEQPGFLDGLLGNILGGGQGSGLLSSPIARAAIGGIAAMALSRMMRR